VIGNFRILPFENLFISEGKPETLCRATNCTGYVAVVRSEAI
jgi:hypothetical protein